MQTVSAFCVLSLYELSILAENLKFLRQRNNLTQTKFAEQYGLNRGNVDSYEKGTEPKLKVLIEIAKSHKVNLMNMLTLKMTQENFHLFAEDMPLMSDVAEDPAATYGDSEIYMLLRDIEDSEAKEQRIDISKKIMHLVNRIMSENSTLRRDMMEYLKKDRK